MRQHQVVVGHLAAVGEGDLLPVVVDADHLTLAEAHVALRDPRRAQEEGDVAGVQAGRGHLVEQRLEGVVGVAVDESDVDVGLAQSTDGHQAGHTTADDHDVRAPTGRHDPNRCAAVSHLAEPPGGCSRARTVLIQAQCPIQWRSASRSTGGATKREVCPRAPASSRSPAAVPESGRARQILAHPGSRSSHRAIRARLGDRSGAGRDRLVRVRRAGQLPRREKVAIAKAASRAMSSVAATDCHSAQECCGSTREWPPPTPRRRP